MMNDALAADAGASQQDKQLFNSQIGKLNQLAWFAGSSIDDSSPEAMARRTKRINLSTQTAFRGITKGDDVGPYLSQFLLAGSKGLGGIHDPADGFVQYGSIRIDQRVRVATPCKDYMEHWLEWLDVQNGADLRGRDSYLAKTDAHTSGGYRFITTPRDLATYVHHDALYEAYLNACLLLLANGIKFDPGIPFQVPDHLDHQQGFAHFGGPHILSLVTEVATRALKAVRYQKFNVHRRMRPEVLAGRLQKYQALNSFAPELETMYNRLQDAGIYDAAGNLAGRSNRLLPMAFPEGSPMHPSYGAGHATVAGACVTILKAFFDHTAKLDLSGHGANKAFVPDPYTHGTTLQKITLSEELTVEGELNKLAANIAIGRDWAGVHYFTDYIESIRLGEKIALGILEEQKLTYNENFSMTVPLFDGGFRTI
jgi:hypothetical protein